MTNFNNRDYDNRDLRDRTDVPRQNPNNPNELTDGVVERRPTTTRTAYQDGYWEGRHSERQVRDGIDVRDEVRSRENESAASGIIFGVLLASLVGLGVGAYYFFTQRDRTPIVVPNVVVPNTSPSPNQPPEVRERVIERDRVVPVPQAAPDVNVTVPNSPPPQVNITQPAPQAAPQTETQAPQAAPESQGSTGSETAPATGEGGQ